MTGTEGYFSTPAGLSLAVLSPGFHPGLLVLRSFGAEENHIPWISKKYSELRTPNSELRTPNSELRTRYSYRNASIGLSLDALKAG